MPYCEVRKEQSGDSSDGASLNNGIKIFYRTYGSGPTKVLLIIGLAGTHDSWGPQIKSLTGTTKPNDEDGNFEEMVNGNSGGGIEVCAFDNRGMGQSSVPVKKSEYTTKTMAKDAIGLLDHLGWKKVHVFGHSMGAMISCKLAAMVPDRILSLALLNVTGGGFECFPKFDRRTLSVAIRFLRAKTPEERAAVDLDTHYTEEYLEELVGSSTRRSILYQMLPFRSTPSIDEFVVTYADKLKRLHTCSTTDKIIQEYVEGISATGMQSNSGFDGQIHACWTHKMKRPEIEAIRNAGFLVSVIHGRYDIIAQIYYARRLAQKLYPIARMIDLHGGHLVSHERPEEVNQALIELINGSEKKINPHDWTNLPKKTSGFLGKDKSCMSSTMEKLHLFLLYLFGLFALAYGYGRRSIQNLKPVKVGTSLK